MRPYPVLALGLSVLCLGLSGCSLSSTATPTPVTGPAISGILQGGRQPIVGAHMYLMAAGITGYGSASTSLLTTNIAGTDSVGGYVVTASDGSFAISGDYTCTPGNQIYLYGLGGDAGSGANTAAGLLAVLGSCPSTGNFLSAGNPPTNIPYIVINEVTTTAAAYATAGFAVDATHIGSFATAQSLIGIQNAFSNAGTLANIVTGVAYASTPTNNGIVPQSEIDSIANILAACVNSTGPSSIACGKLLPGAPSAGTSGTIPTDTATAAINIAHYPAANVTTLYSLEASSTPFQPTLTAQPSDFTVTLLIPTNAAQPAVDASGNVWTCATNPSGTPVLYEYASNGALLSPAAGYTGGGLGASNQICYGPLAIDPTGNIWLLGSNTSTNTPELVGYSSNGTPLTGSPFTGNGLNYQRAIAINGSGVIWVADGGSTAGTSYISRFASNGGAAGLPITGNGLNNPSSIAIDQLGSVWVYGTVLSKFTSTGATATGSPFGAVSHNQTPIAIDSFNDVWLDDPSDSGMVKLTNAGAAVSGSPFTVGGASNGNYGLAIDGLDNVWADSQTGSFGPGSLNEIANSGGAIAPPTGYLPQGLGDSNNPILIDPSGSVWVVGNENNAGSTAILSITIGAASPVVTPIALGLKNGTLGTRP